MVVLGYLPKLKRSLGLGVLGGLLRKRSQNNLQVPSKSCKEEQYGRAQKNIQVKTKLLQEAFA